MHHHQNPLDSTYLVIYDVCISKNCYVYTNALNENLVQWGMGRENTHITRWACGAVSANRTAILLMTIK
jgi:hypothetical protein